MFPIINELRFVVSRLREEWSWEGSTGAGEDQRARWDWWDFGAMGESYISRRGTLDEGKTNKRLRESEKTRGLKHGVTL